MLASFAAATPPVAFEGESREGAADGSRDAAGSLRRRPPARAPATPQRSHMLAFVGVRGPASVQGLKSPAHPADNETPGFVIARTLGDPGQRGFFPIRRAR